MLNKSSTYAKIYKQLDKSYQKEVDHNAKINNIEFAKSKLLLFGGVKLPTKSSYYQRLQAMLSIEYGWLYMI